MTRGLFVRVSDEAYEMLHENLRGMQASRAPGEAPPTLGALVERCIMGTLAPVPVKARKKRTK